mgnify:CR=1 FL=1
MASNELTPSQNAFAAMSLSQDELTELFKANIGAHGLSPFLLERVKIPASGSTTWMVPSLDGDVPAKEIEGVVIHKKDPRVFWIKSIKEGAGGGQPPECYSEEGDVGYGIRDLSEASGRHDCLTCPMSQFRRNPDGTNTPPRCSQRMALFVLRKEGILPMMMILPPTSVQPMFKYFLGKLLHYEKSYNKVITIFSLEKTRNLAGQEYSRVVPKYKRDLTKEEVSQIQTYISQIKPALDRARIIVDEDEGE